MRRILLALLVLAPLAAWPAPVTITGRVVDAQKAPIGGAQVWVVLGPHMREEASLLGSGRSGDDGSFSLAGVDVPDGEAGARLTVVAHAEGLAFGWQPLALPLAARESLELVCPAPAALTGRIVDGDGKGIAARVEPTHVAGPHMGLDFGTSSAVVLPPELEQALAVSTDAEGRFTVRICPVGGRTYLSASAEGLGSLGFGGEPGDLGQIVMLPPGSIRVRLTCEAAPDAVADVELKAAGRDERTGAWAAAAVTDANGVATLGPMRPGAITVRQEGAPNAQWRMPGAKVELKPAETLELEVELKPTVPVTGRVVDAQTGEPVAGAGVGVSFRDALGRLALSATGDDGAYGFRALPGALSVYVTTYPKGYGSGEGGSGSAEVQVAAEPCSVPDLKVYPVEKVRGIVVDAEGRPVAKAVVYQSLFFTGNATTGPDGVFELQRTVSAPGVGVQEGEGMQLWARAGESVTKEPVDVSPGVTGPIRLVVEDNAGVRARVRAVDEAGRPVTGAHVAIHWLMGRYGTSAATGTTGADGCYQSPLLWPFGKYTVVLTEPTHRMAQTADWTPEPGETHDFGDLVMASAPGLVAGRVLDADDTPVAEARVCANGEGPDELKAATDADGAFSLRGLYEGGVWVTAWTEEAIGGARLTTGTQDVTITLVPWPREVQLGQPVVASSCSDRETELRLAAELLDEAMARYGDGADDYVVSGLVCAWAALDPAKAMELSAQRGGKFDGQVCAALAIAAIDQAPEEVTGYLDGVPAGQERVWALVDTAQHARRTQPGLSRELAMLAVDEGRALENTCERVIYMAAAAEALYGLDPQGAEPAIREVADLAARIGAGERDAYARGCAAEALCRLDLPAALALLTDIVDEREGTRHQPNIAARIAATQPDKAAELLAEADEWQRDYELPRVVYAMAPAAPEKALELARGSKQEAHKIRALAYVALALYPQTPERAATVLQEAIGLVSAPSEANRDPYLVQQLCPFAGELCWVAAQMGYPAVDNLAWLALSLRTPDAGGGWGGSDESLKCLRSLALVRPRMVADFVTDALQQPGALEVRAYSPVPGHLALAAAASDAQVAAKVLRATDPRAEGDRRGSDTRLWSQTIDLLLTRPEDRPVALLATYGDWVPGALNVD